MRWLSNVRLPSAESGVAPGAGGVGGAGGVCGAGGAGGEPSWRVGLDDDGTILGLRPIEAGSAAAGLDWRGDWLSPMGVDLQINGGLGLAFPELSRADLPRLDELLERLWRDGVEAISPTLVTCGFVALRGALAVLAEARARHAPGRCRPPTRRLGSS